MAFIDWNDGFSVGVSLFDEQHKKLVALINQLHDAMSKGVGKQALEGVFQELIDYTGVHFTAEEKYFAEYGYPEAQKHIGEHKDLVKQALELQAKFKSGAMLISIEVLNFLKNWLEHHILEVDKRYGAHFNAKGIK